MQGHGRERNIDDGDLLMTAAVLDPSATVAGGPVL
jgi:hypothetical protein